jgi:hypothetical protein
VPLELKVLREVDGSHAARAELTLEVVAAVERGFDEVAHERNLRH